MSCTDGQLLSLLTGTARPARSVRMMDAWDILERFSQELPGCEEPGEQIALLLQAVRDCVRADAVFFHPGAGTESVVFAAGGRHLPADWARDLVGRVLQNVAAGASEVLCAGWHDGTDAEPLDPDSVILVRLSKTRSAWVVALRFDVERSFGPADLKPLALARRIFLNHYKHSRLHHKLKDTLFGLIHCLTEAIDAKDPYTCGHSERVARIATRLGQEMGLPSETVGDVYLAGLLHDVGKIGIRDSVLQKPGQLTEPERAHIQQHTIIGDRIVANIRQLDHLRPGVRNHHERYDGQGYPDRLAGPTIPLLARILAVADACDAMMADRPYRRALPPGRIDAILREGAGQQWDPEVVGHFLACRHELYPICQRGIGESVVRAVENTVRAISEDGSYRLWVPLCSEDTGG